MKANELMIGDWVNFNGSFDKVQEICYIQGSGMCASFAASATLFPMKMELIKPIPLTKEILENNGFERHRIFDGGSMEENWKLSDDYYDIKVYEWSDSIWVYRYEGTEMNIPHEQIVISHVNELQHALRLCGIEKEIEL